MCWCVREGSAKEGLGVPGAGEVFAGSWEGTEGNLELGEPWKLERSTGSCRGSSEWGHRELLGSTGSCGGEGTGSWGGTGRHWGLRGALGTGRSTGSRGSLGTGGLRGAAMVTGSAGGSTGSCRDGSGRRALGALGSVVHVSVLGGVVRAPSAYWELWSRARAMLGVVVPQPRALLEAVVLPWGGGDAGSRPPWVGGSRGCQPLTDPSALSGLPSPCPRGVTGPSAGRPWGSRTIPRPGEERGGSHP